MDCRVVRAPLEMWTQTQYKEALLSEALSKTLAWLPGKREEELSVLGRMQAQGGREGCEDSSVQGHAAQSSWLLCRRPGQVKS